MILFKAGNNIACKLVGKLPHLVQILPWRILLQSKLTEHFHKTCRTEVKVVSSGTFEDYATKRLLLARFGV